MELLGLHLDEAKEYLHNKNIHFCIKYIEGKKDKDRLTIPRVIRAKQVDEGVELIVTYFTDSLQ
ncbi:MAG: hypothetical protein LBN09_03390 [Clostridioides sp.]|nr:hypothetical protein [Clostridioides sp.]